MAFFCHFHGSPSIHSPLCINSNLFQGINRALAQILIIVHHQHSPRRKLHVFQFGIRLFQVKYNVKLCPFTRRALHINTALHRVHNRLRNRHSKTRTFDFINLCLLFSCKRIKNLFKKLFCHPDTAVLHEKMAPHIIITNRRLLLFQVNIDSSALRRKL